MEDRRQLHIQRGLTPSEIPPKRVYKKRICRCPICEYRAADVMLAERDFLGLYCPHCAHKRMLVLRTITYRV